MSHVASHWAIRQTGISSTAKLVLMVLADYHNIADGGCFPSIPTLAKVCCCEDRTVQRAIKELCEAGMVEKNTRLNDSGRQRSNQYNLVLPQTLMGDNMTPTTPANLTPLEPVINNLSDTSYRADDPDKLFWDDAKLMAEALKIPPKSQNSLIGKLRKMAANDKLVLEAMADALFKEIVDPVPWLIAAVGGKKKSHAQQQKDRIDDAFEQLRLQGERRRAALEAAANEGHASGGGGSENYGEFQLEPSEEPRSVSSERRLGPPTIPALYTEDVSRSGGWDFE